MQDGVKIARVGKATQPITGSIVIPGSKSVTNRALILAAMAEGTSTLSAILRSDDSHYCIEVLKALGTEIDVNETDAVIKGIGRRRPVATGDLYVGSAGTITRFLPGVLAAGEAGKWNLSGSAQITSRPVAPLFDALRAGGATIACTGQDGCLPATVEGASFQGGNVSIAGDVSSQFVSGMLIAGALAPKPLELDIIGHIVQSDYVRITLDTMAHFAVEAEAAPDLSKVIVPNTGYKAHDLVIEADASTATYFAAFAAVTNGRVELPNLPANTLQPDIEFLDILEKLGCSVSRSEAAITVAGTDTLRGNQSFDMRPLSDAALTLAALAPFADGPITITGVEHIRHHECDRIDAMCKSLKTLEIQVDEHRDGMTITPGKPQFAELDTFEDHRMAMALTVLGAGGSGVALRDPGCVAKTCPTFFDMVASMGLDVELLT